MCRVCSLNARGSISVAPCQAPSTSPPDAVAWVARSHWRSPCYLLHRNKQCGVCHCCQLLWRNTCRHRSLIPQSLRMTKNHCWFLYDTSYRCNIDLHRTNATCHRCRWRERRYHELEIQLLWRTLSSGLCISERQQAFS